MSVKRVSPVAVSDPIKCTNTAEMKEHPEGFYVLYAEYESLETEHEALRKDLAYMHISYAQLLLRKEGIPGALSDHLRNALRPTEPTAPAFTCPACGGHSFGTSRNIGSWKDGPQTVHCQNGQKCRWTGPHAEHVHND